MDNPTIGVGDLELWSALLGMAVPWVAGLVNRSEWGSFARWLVFAAACVVAAGVTTYLEGGLSLAPEAFVRSLLVIGTLGSYYYGRWKPAIREVEAGVNVIPRPKAGPGQG